MERTNQFRWARADSDRDGSVPQARWGIHSVKLQQKWLVPNPDFKGRGDRLTIAEWRDVPMEDTSP